MILHTKAYNIIGSLVVQEKILEDIFYLIWQLFWSCDLDHDHIKFDFNCQMVSEKKMFECIDSWSFSVTMP